MGKVSKILLIVIYILLAVFLGFGVYFTVQGILGTGMIGIGVFMAGAGLTAFLQFYMMRDEIIALHENTPVRRQPVARKQDPSEAELDVDAKLIRIGNTNKTSLSGSVRIYAEKFHLDGLYPSSVVVYYSDVKSMELRGDVLVLSTGFILNDKQDAAQFHIIVNSGLKRKALMQVLERKTNMKIR